MKGIKRSTTLRWCTHAMIASVLVGCAGSEKNSGTSRTVNATSVPTGPTFYGQSSATGNYNGSAGAYNSFASGTQNQNYATGYSASPASSSSGGGMGGMLLLAGALVGGGYFLKSATGNSSSSSSSKSPLDKILGRKTAAPSASPVASPAPAQANAAGTLAANSAKPAEATTEKAKDTIAATAEQSAVAPTVTPAATSETTVAAAATTTATSASTTSAASNSAVAKPENPAVLCRDGGNTKSEEDRLKELFTQAKDKFGPQLKGMFNGKGVGL